MKRSKLQQMMDDSDDDSMASSPDSDEVSSPPVEDPLPPPLPQPTNSTAADGHTSTTHGVTNRNKPDSSKGKSILWSSLVPSPSLMKESNHQRPSEREEATIGATGSFFDQVVEEELSKARLRSPFLLKHLIHVAHLQWSNKSLLNLLASFNTGDDNIDVNDILQERINALLMYTDAAVAASNGRGGDLVSPKSKSTLSKVQSLSLEGNGLTALRGVDFILPKLNQLSLANNHLTLVNLRFRNLTILDLSHNKLTTLEYLDLPNLQVLDVSYNSMEGDIQSVICIYDHSGVACPNLRELNLSNNLLQWKHPAQNEALQLIASLTPKVKVLNFLDNPFIFGLSEELGYLDWRARVRTVLPKLKRLDQIEVSTVFDKLHFHSTLHQNEDMKAQYVECVNLSKCVHRQEAMLKIETLLYWRILRAKFLHRPLLFALSSTVKRCYLKGAFFKWSSLVTTRCYSTAKHSRKHSKLKILTRTRLGSGTGTQNRPSLTLSACFELWKVNITQSRKPLPLDLKAALSVIPPLGIKTSVACNPTSPQINNGLGVTALPAGNCVNRTRLFVSTNLYFRVSEGLKLLSVWVSVYNGRVLKRAWNRLRIETVAGKVVRVCKEIQETAEYLSQNQSVICEVDSLLIQNDADHRAKCKVLMDEASDESVQRLMKSVKSSQEQVGVLQIKVWNMERNFDIAFTQ